MIRRFWPLTAALGTALALGACGSNRFANAGGPGTLSGPGYNAPSAAAPGLEPVPAMPSGPVVAEPLPALPGEPGPVASVTPGGGPMVSDVPVMPGAPGPVESLRSGASPSGGGASGGRSSVFGAWTARDATGTSCRVQLSSAPALDLYKASASGCGNRDLARITAWDYREGEVYLYQPGGTVAARLRASGGAMEGVLAKSGAPLALAR